MRGDRRDSKPLGEELKGLEGVDISSPLGAIGLLLEYVGGRIQRELRPDRLTRAHPDLESFAASASEQVKRLRSLSEVLLREHGSMIVERQFQLKRLADAVADIYAEVAVLSRVTAIFDEQGVEPSGQERYIAETFCRRAGDRVNTCLDRVEQNDDERAGAIAKLAFKRGEYGYAFFED